ncbi:MAG: hypothetical protein C0596_07960 [Marinilabiliales bacterium]|nr:MAG: hypothetical protein C0596_07960 [Marinilabiliales bacterium]
MGQSKKIVISEDDLREWLASTGSLFPENKLELARFEKLYADFHYTIDESCVDPFKIISGEYKPQNFTRLNEDSDNTELKMAARNLGEIPEHIMKKIRKNQNGSGSKEKGISEQED